MTNTNVSILLIGNELLDGRLNDTNSHYLSKELAINNFNVIAKYTVADKEEEILESLNYLSNKSDVILISGGLGPTSDDLTREVLAKFLNVELVQSKIALSDLKKYYKIRNRELNQSNLKQTFIPSNSTLVRNLNGTASLFRSFSKEKNVHIACFPGVPSELKAAFSENILPWMNKNFKKEQLHLKTYRFFGIPESSLHEQIENLNFSKQVQISYRASFPEIQLVLKSYNQEILEDTNNILLKNVSNKNLFSIDSSISLPLVLHNLLLDKNFKIALAESCTGGLISSLLVSNAGSSNYFSGGVVSYSNESKENLIDVSSDTLKNFGAVSAECASEMAKGVRRKFKSNISISITGIAGPDGGSEDKPVGTFYIGLADEHSVISKKCFFFDKRNRFQTYAAYTALNFLRNHIQQNN